MPTKIRKGPLRVIKQASLMPPPITWGWAKLECGHEVSIGNVNQKRARCSKCLAEFPAMLEPDNAPPGVEGAHEGTTADKSGCENCETLQAIIDAGRAEDARMTREILRLEERIRLTEPSRPEIPCVRKLIAALNQYESFPTVANFVLIKAAWTWVEAEPINICPIHNKKQPCCGSGSREPEKLNNAQKAETKGNENMSTQTALSNDDPRMIAWNKYKESAEYQNTKKWALHPDHVDGSLWAAWLQGYTVALAESSLSSPPPELNMTRADDGTPEFLWFGGKYYTIDHPECMAALLKAIREFPTVSRFPIESGAESVHSGKQNSADKSELLPTQLPKEK